MITVRNNMRNMTMRWKGGTLYMSVPAGVSRADIERVLDDMRPKLRKTKDKYDLSYHRGQVIQCYGFSITLGEQDRLPGRIVFGHGETHATVSVPQGTDFDNHNTKEWISKALKVVAHEHAARVLLPLANSITERVGVAPSRFEIGRGLRKLGHCTPGRVIQLSANLVFLPAELIELIVCHELAHLTHMNHSPQFHALVNTYLMGREKELEKKLKAFNWPLMR
jgi:predicted metal-dependent hydrolase